MGTPLAPIHLESSTLGTATMNDGNARMLFNIDFNNNPSIELHAGKTGFTKGNVTYIDFVVTDDVDYDVRFAMADATAGFADGEGFYIISNVDIFLDTNQTYLQGLIDEKTDLSATYTLLSHVNKGYVDNLLTTNISGTTNYISKFTSSNTIGNSQIFDNGTNVGIGTILPGAKLDVNGFIHARLGIFSDNITTYNSAPFTLSAAGDIKFLTNGTDVVRIKNTGNVGIGILNPTAIIHSQSSNDLNTDFVAKFDSLSNSILHLRNDGSVFFGNNNLRIYNTLLKVFWTFELYIVCHHFLQFCVRVQSLLHLNHHHW